MKYCKNFVEYTGESEYEIGKVIMCKLFLCVTFSLYTNRRTFSIKKGDFFLNQQIGLVISYKGFVLFIMEMVPYSTSVQYFENKFSLSRGASGILFSFFNRCKYLGGVPYHLNCLCLSSTTVGKIYFTVIFPLAAHIP